MSRIFLLFLIISSLYLRVDAQQANTYNWYKFKTKIPNKSAEFLNTQSQWSKLENAYDVNFYFLNLNVSSDTVFIKGSASITAHAVTSLDTIALELIPDMTIDSVFLNNTNLSTWSHVDNELLFPLSATQEKGSVFTIQIYYEGQPPTGGFFAGVTHARSKTWNKDVTWTLSEPFAAKDWFPVKQSLKDKADSAWIFLTTPSNEMAGSEGVLTKIVNLPDGHKRYEWKTRYPIDYYLLSFAVSDYQDYCIYAHPTALHGDSILIQNFVYNNPDFLMYNKADIDKTAKLIDLYSSLFGLYPFSKEKYGHCLTELGGGMEHQTMTTIGGFGFDLVAHELGHMWFGDNVTCATWSDIWVNEGFATYADYLANEYLNGPQAASGFIVKAQNSAMSQPGGSIYVPEAEIYPGNEWRIFNGRLSYDKGAAILHMLRHEINNDTLFFNILKAYQKSYGGGVATGKNFEYIVDSLSGEDYSYFFNQWYFGEGYPVFTIQWNQNNGVLNLRSIQNTSTQNTKFFKMDQDFLIHYRDNSDTVIRLQQSENVSSFEIQLSKPIESLEVDPKHWNLQKVDSIVIDNVSEINNPAGFSLYPNPASQFTNIRFYDNNTFDKKIMLIATNGHILWDVKTRKSSIRLNLSGYPKGIYLLTAVVNNKYFVQKIAHEQ